MNSWMNITIRVNSGKARAELAAFNTQAAAMQTTMNHGTVATSRFGMASLGSLNALERFGKNLQWTGRQIEYNFTLPIILAAGAATKFAFDNEAAMTRLRKVYGSVRDDQAELRRETDALARSFELLSNRFGVTQSEVIGIGAAWAQAGAAGVGLGKAVKQTLELMILGELDATAATEGLIAIQAAFRLSTDQLRTAIAQLNIIENETSIGLGDLIEVIGRAGGVAQDAGLQINELAAMAAILVPAAGSGAQAGNSLRTMISRLLAPTREAVELWREMGIEVEAASWITVGARGRLEQLSVAYQELTGQQQAQVASTAASRWQINRFSLLMDDLALSLDDATRAQSVFARAVGISTAAASKWSEDTQYNAQYTKELLTVLQSSPRAFKIFITQIQNAMAKAIGPMIPTIIGLIGWVTKMVTWFANLSDGTRGLVLAFLFMIAAVGPLGRIIGATSLLVSLLGRGFHFAMLHLFGYSAATLAAIGTEEAHQLSLLQTHGILGGLIKRIADIGYALYRLPLMIMAKAFDLFWLTISLGGKGALLAFRLVGDGLRTFLGPSLLRAVGNGFMALWNIIVMGAPAALATIKWVVTTAAGVTALGVQAAARGVANGIGFMFTLTSRMIGQYLASAVTLTQKVSAVFKGIWFAATTAVLYGWKALQAGAGIIGRGISEVWDITAAFMRRVWYGTGRFFLSIWNRTALLLEKIWYGFQVAWVMLTHGLIGIWQRTVALIHRIWLMMTFGLRTLWMNFVLFVGYAGQRMATMVQSIFNFIGGAWQAITVFMARVGAASFGVISKLFTSMAVFFANPMNTIARMWAFTVVKMKAIWTAFLAFFSGGWIAVVAAIIVALGILAYAFRDKLAGVWDWIVDQFNKLPQGIQNALLTVARMLQRWAEQIAEWLSYLNPFARHSPSLVDNVKRGVATILNEYSKLVGIRSIIRNAIGALAAFNAATGTAMQGAQLGEYQQQRAEIVAVAPGAGDEVDTMINSIFELQGALELVGQEIEAQSGYVAEWRSSIESAMAPINDAIFENEMAQKRLRLEMLKIEQAGGSIEDVQSKLAALNGEIEGMRADREDLRLAGAGSDVLGFYDNQIKALEDQKDALAATTGPLNDLQKQLEELQLQSEIMQLERDINFDPQLRALEKEEEKLAELEAAYRDIEGAVRDMEGALRGAANASKEIAAAAAAASDSFAVEQFRAAEGLDFETFGGETIPGLGREGGLAEIEAFNEQLEAELAAQMEELGKMDIFGPFKDMFKQAWTWIVDNVGPYVTPVWDKLVAFWNTIDWNALWGNISTTWNNIWSTLGDDTSSFGSIFSTVGEYIGIIIDELRMVWDFLVESFGPVWEWLKTTVIDAATSIFEELKNWAPLFDPLIEAIGHIVNVMKDVLLPVFAVVLGAIMAAWKLVWPVLKNVLTPIIDAIVGVIRAGLEIIRGIIGFVLNIINGDWGAAWQSILTVVDGVWDAIYSVIKLPIDLIIGIVRGLVEGIVDFFTWLWDILVGNSIIPDLMNAIVGWFEFLTSPIKAVWDAIWAAIQWAWEHGIKPIWEGIKLYWDTILKPVIEGIRSVFETVFNGIKNTVSTVWDGIKLIFQNIIDFVKNSLATAWDPFKSATETVFNGIKNVIGLALRPIGDVIGGFLGVVASIADAVGLDSFAGTLRSASDSAYGWGEGMATGGVIPHEALSPFKTSGPVAIVGEGRSAYPEYVIPTDPAYRSRAQALWSAAGSDLQMYAFGGLIGDAFNSVTSGIGSAVSWVGDQIENVAREAAAGAMRHAWPQLLNMSPYSGWSRSDYKTIIPAAHDSIREKVIEWVEGGARAEVERFERPLTRAETFARAQAGKPYVWGAVGPDGYDCSGFMSAIANVISDRENVHRRLFTTSSMYGTLGIAGFRRNQNTGFRIGVYHNDKFNTGHTAGTLFTGAGELNVEATPNRVRVGPGARGWEYGTQHFGYQYARGGLLPGDMGILRSGMSIPALFSNGMGMLSMNRNQLALQVPGLYNGGLVKGSLNGTLVRVGDRNRDELVQPLPRDFSSGETTNNFYGDMSFPNIKSGDDAEKFIQNLRELAGD